MNAPVPRPAPIRVLLVEDVPSEAELELRELRRAGMRVTHRIVDDEPSFVEALQNFHPDVILSDFSMPRFDGMSALALARELAPDVPFVFVSGTIGEEYAIRALKNGATDYVLKNNLMRLPATIERALEESRARRERAKVDAELHSVRERLTGIMKSLPDMFWSVELPSERILYVGANSVEIFGYTQEQFLRDPDLWRNVVHPDDRLLMLRAWKQFVAGTMPYDIEYRVLRADGGARWVNDRGHIVRGKAGQPERIDGVVRDISEQVEHRRRIARLSRIRDFSSSINAALIRLRDRGALFQEICRIAVEVGGFKGAHVGVRAADSGSVQWVAQHGRAITGPEAPASARTDVASFPLVVEGQDTGVFSLHAGEAGFFDQEEIALLRELASNVSFALELISKQDQIAYLALYDGLTGLPNRTLFQERLTQALVSARGAGGHVGLALIDLERFKAINDTLGRHGGDRVLQAVARRAQDSAGDINRVARLGSDVFALVFPMIQGAEEVARQLGGPGGRFFNSPFDIDGREVRLAAKAGVAVYPEDGEDAEALLRNAEAALKQAKETGEPFLFYAPEINARVSEQVTLEHHLRKAVEGGELFLHFQPKLELETRRIVGLEALMRWTGPDGKLVSPASFVPVLEETGLILEAGRQAIAAASATYRRWQAAGLNPPRIAVNVSALQLRRRSFVEDLRSALVEADRDGGGLDLEITESLLMSDVEESIRKLSALREMGMRVALDDFGTGYSSLAYLSKLPLDALKIDRGFVRGITEHSGDTSIISTIISLAQTLRLKVVAEGVETEQQAQLLRLLRCDEAQGFLFSRPLPAADVEKLIKSL